MRKTQLSLMTMLLLAVVFSSCKKESDYRNKYIGYYLFEYRYHDSDVLTPWNHGTGSDYKGLINYDEDQEDLITINYAPGRKETYGINESGTLYKCGKPMGYFSSTNEVVLDYKAYKCYESAPSGFEELVEFTGKR